MQNPKNQSSQPNEILQNEITLSKQSWLLILSGIVFIGGSVILLEARRNGFLRFSSTSPSPVIEQTTEAPTETAEIVPADSTQPASAPAASIPTISPKQAITDYEAGMFAIDGVSDLVTSINLVENADRLAQLNVTPYFEIQSTAEQEEFAMLFWRAWNVSAQTGEDETVYIRLVNSRGDIIGGSAPLRGVYIKD